MTTTADNYFEIRESIKNATTVKEVKEIKNYIQNDTDLSLYWEDKEKLSKQITERIEEIQIQESLDLWE